MRQYIVKVRSKEYRLGWLYLVAADTAAAAKIKTQTHLETEKLNATAKSAKLANADDVTNFDKYQDSVLA